MLEDKIPVQIFGQTYEILGSQSETLYYHSLARYVEDKMKEIMAHTNVVSTQKVAVLAALNIAEELFRERENKSMGGRVVEKKLDDLVKKLDQSIREPGDPAPKARKPAPAPVPEESAYPQELELI